MAEKKNEPRQTTAAKTPEQGAAVAGAVRTDEPRFGGDVPKIEGDIEYVDLGTQWKVIDSRPGGTGVTFLPKNSRDIPVSKEDAEAIRAQAEADPTISDDEIEHVVPPVKGEDDG